VGGGGGGLSPDSVNCPGSDAAHDQDSNRRRCALQPMPKSARPLDPSFSKLK